MINYTHGIFVRDKIVIKLSRTDIFVDTRVVVTLLFMAESKTKHGVCFVSKNVLNVFRVKFSCPETFLHFPV